MTSKESRDKRKAWYLETSVLRTLLFGHSLSKREVLRHLNGIKRWSSFYVLMEYKRSVIKTLIDLYFVAVEEDTPSDAIQYFSQGFRPRETKLILSALGQFIEEADITNDKEKFLVKLKTFISGATQFFDDIVDYYSPNKTHCPLAKASTAESYQKFLEEIDCKMHCRVEKLWKESRGKLRILIDAADQPEHKKNRGFTEPLALINKAIADSTAPKTKSNCMKAGDFVIALEMPNNLRMLTFDRAFDSICGILGREVVVLPSLTALRKEGKESAVS